VNRASEVKFRRNDSNVTLRAGPATSNNFATMEIIPGSWTGRYRLSITFGGRDWEAVLSGQLHTWGHALNSSQAFAGESLFGPARFSKAVARALLEHSAGSRRRPRSRPRLMSTSSTAGPDKAFAKAELGEAGKPTQIDVAIEGMFSRWCATDAISSKLSSRSLSRLVSRREARQECA